MDWIDYRERLGIGVNDERKFQIFKTRVINQLRDLYSNHDEIVTVGEYCIFCNTAGIEIQRDLTSSLNSAERYKECVHILEKYDFSLEYFLSYYVLFMNTVRSDKKSDILNEFFPLILTTSLKATHIPYDLYEDSDGQFIFPKGVDEFDDALVSQPLLWLNDYPKAEKAWVKALREYAEEESEKASDVADLFRKALEAFFQEFFTGGKSLENYKSDYGSYLKAQGIPPAITNNFETLLQAYTNFVNDYAKHHDATSDKVLEYLMYQTGNIMRLLITLKQGEKKDAD